LGQSDHSGSGSGHPIRGGTPSCGAAAARRTHQQTVIATPVKYGLGIQAQCGASCKIRPTLYAL
jgi:hypothetical protein